MAKRQIFKKIGAFALNATSAVAGLAGREGLASLTGSLAGKLTASPSPAKESGKALKAGAPPAASTPAKASAAALKAGSPPAVTNVAKANSQLLKGTAKVDALTTLGSKSTTKSGQEILDDLTGKKRESANVLYIVGGIVAGLIVLAMTGGGRKLKRLLR